ncbi:MAG: hypothetical protein AAFX41_17865, partial [Bacteroidota bacterium]
LDVRGALEDDGRVQGDALSPKLYRSDEGEVILIEDTGELWSDPSFGASFLWSDGYLWSDAYLWSDGYLWSDAYLWSDGFLWSDAFLWSDSYLWTDNTIWGDAFLWSDSVMWSKHVQDHHPLMEVKGNSVSIADD